jgi:hypothetical protein
MTGGPLTRLDDLARLLSTSSSSNFFLLIDLGGEEQVRYHIAIKAATERIPELPFRQAYFKFRG